MSAFLNIALPRQRKAYVRSEFLHDGDAAHVGKYERCIVERVVIEPGHVPRFMVLTERGALFRGVPIHALCSRPCPAPALELLVLWNCMSFNAAVYESALLSDVDVKLTNGMVERGSYLFTIDYCHADSQRADSNWCQMPDEHKQHNVIELDSGQWCAQPGNRCVWRDASFVAKPWDLNAKKCSEDAPTYKTMTQTWSVEARRVTEDSGALFYDVQIANPFCGRVDCTHGCQHEHQKMGSHDVVVYPPDR